MVGGNGKTAFWGRFLGCFGVGMGLGGGGGAVEEFVEVAEVEGVGSVLKKVYS